MQMKKDASADLPEREGSRPVFWGVVIGGLALWSLLILAGAVVKLIG